MNQTIGRPWPRRFNISHYNEMKLMRQQGMKYRVIAKRFRCSIKTVWKAVNS